MQEHKSVAIESVSLQKEVWECRACGVHAPCRVEIIYEPTAYEDIEKRPRMKRFACICNEPTTPQWKMQKKDGGKE